MKGKEALLPQLKNSPVASPGTPRTSAPAAPGPGGRWRRCRTAAGAARSGLGPRRCHTPVLHQRWPLPARRPRPNRTASAWSKVKNDTAGKKSWTKEMFAGHWIFLNLLLFQFIISSSRKSSVEICILRNMKIIRR